MRASKIAWSGSDGREELMACCGESELTMFAMSLIPSRLAMCCCTFVSSLGVRCELDTIWALRRSLKCNANCDGRKASRNVKKKIPLFYHKVQQSCT